MATGISDRTIRKGIRQLDDLGALPPDRQRTPGAGRRSREQEAPGPITALEALMEPIWLQPLLRVRLRSLGDRASIFCTGTACLVPRGFGVRGTCASRR